MAIRNSFVTHSVTAARHDSMAQSVVSDKTGNEMTAGDSRAGKGREECDFVAGLQGRLPVQVSGLLARDRRGQPPIPKFWARLISFSGRRNLGRTPRLASTVVRLINRRDRIKVYKFISSMLIVIRHPKTTSCRYIERGKVVADV